MSVTKFSLEKMFFRLIMISSHLRGSVVDQIWHLNSALILKLKDWGEIN